MDDSDSPPPPPPRPDFRDAAIVLASVLAASLLASVFELNERLFRLTRRLEFYQLDELPFVLLVLCIGLGWLAARRHRKLRAEIDSHVMTGQRLQRALAANRKLATERIQAEEHERKRLARDLHDELGQYLSLIRLDALQIDESVADSPNRRHVDSITQGVEHLQRTVRSMMSDLRPVALDDLGLSAALEHCIAIWRDRAAPMRFRLATSGDLDALPEDTALAAYRIIQEGLTNAVRHSRGRSVSLELDVAAGFDKKTELRIRLADDGLGLPAEPDPAARGLRGIRERTELAGGRFTIGQGIGGGAELKVTLPYLGPR
jgi:signal transduction histidine kinase